MGPGIPRRQPGLQWRFQDVELHTSCISYLTAFSVISWSQWVQGHPEKAMTNGNTCIKLQTQFSKASKGSGKK